MFKKILIANRGEIACRIIKTARRMGIQTVAVYSDADKDALHVDMADEAVHIGPPPAAESYLIIERIIEACRKTGAEAVHPGYGFLSEREAFANALKDAGIVFIGPNPGAIAAMGDKIESKKFANAAKVSTVPGFLGVIEDADHAVRISDEIGYPVMLKASAGGGGKGMRIAWSRDEVAEGFTRAKSEAKSSFGDDRVFVEKFIVNPRHIEIQVLGDKHGNVIYLGERECSIQRRNQKVIEEAPSPLLDEETRRRMGEQAVALAKAVNYDSAGTVEFVAGQDKSFFFLEMNTRLQVEHPVTELITGVDLVEQMIRVAAGEPLALKQSDVKLRGWAVESRIYAEDPTRNFLPSTGRLITYRPPAEEHVEGITVRNDTGVFEGGEISIYYDPMIAKLVTYGDTRNAAIGKMAEALDSFVINGVSHNIGFLAAVIARDSFRSGDITTDFIAQQFPDGFKGEPLPPEQGAQAIAVAAAAQRILAESDARIAGVTLPDRWVIVQDGSRYPAKISRRNETIIVAGYTASQEVTTSWLPGQSLFHGSIDGVPTVFQIERHGIGWRLTRGASIVDLKVLPPLAADALGRMPAKAKPDLSRQLFSPMPGLLVSMAVTQGQDVKAGEELAVIEAMKMENVLRAERDGTIKQLFAKAGDSLAVDQIILEYL